MYLEQRVEQLEQLTVDHGRQIESIAKGLAELTIDVKSNRQETLRGFEEVRQQFKQVDQRFDQVDQRFEQVDQRFEQVDRRFEQVDQRFEQVDRRFDQVEEQFKAVHAQLADIRQVQTLILTILQEKLK
ncbi:hypothetical protein [Arsenicibacter rosenii]|uniref:t-SNARE coiled-coil homology domain-containing protein n=1 Tax=Arsenicibacter rosenii TaxID=1750698 RepID=A0A1S2VJE5_9BACT|nr:hypothetical protein [Arsenicibacter rosenii]OIN58355.1 hypothetical protein BLX24_15290 [Arsenicibacter rosenii]